MQLSFPFGVLFGICQCSELPLSLTWPALLTVAVLFSLWVRNCLRLNTRLFFTRHKNLSGFNFVALTFMVLAAGGVNAGAAIAWYMVRGYMGVAAVGGVVAVAAIVFVLYAYPKGIRALNRALSQ